MNRSWRFVATVVVSLAVLVAAGFAVGFIQIREKPETKPPMSLCEYIDDFFADANLDPRNATPTAVLHDPALGDETDPSSGETRAVEPNAAATYYVLAQSGLLTPDTTDVVTIPDEIAEDYRTFAQELYRIAIENRGQDAAPPGPAAEQAAMVVEDYLTSHCGTPPAG